jgi:Mn-dependent DtxR family transcriptional regulator
MRSKVKRKVKVDFERLKLKENEKEEDKEIKHLQTLKTKLNVSNKDVWGMIEVLIKAGYVKHHFTFLTQSGLAYSSAFDEIRAGLLAEGEIDL